MSTKTLILGGAKSGKSSLALELGGRHDGPRLFVATAQAGDAEMAQRIARHQAQRGPEWTTVEEPLALAQTLNSLDRPERLILVDCLTLWLGNLLTVAGLEAEAVEQRGRQLADTVAGLAGPIILVANEVGLGIVPDNPLARAFRDLAGGLNQGLARICDQVVFTAAGLPLVLKPGGGQLIL